MKKDQILILFLTLLIPFTPVLKAQENEIPQIKDPKAKAILDPFIKKSAAYKTIHAEFLFTLENEMENITENYSGVLAIKEKKYKLSLMGIDTYCDGNTVWTHLVDAEEVNITTRDTSDGSFMSNPEKLFTQWENNYKYKLIKEEKTDIGFLATIELYPEHLEQGLVPDEEQTIDYSKIILVIDKGNLSLVSVKYVGKNGTNYFIEINRLLTNQNYDDSFFVFDPKKFPDVEVVDLRDE